jgi:hypothetical protein
MPSRPSLQAWRNTTSPSFWSRCSFSRRPEPALARTETSVALRTSSGSRRRSSPPSSIRSKAYRKTLASCRDRRRGCHHRLSRNGAPAPPADKRVRSPDTATPTVGRGLAGLGVGKASPACARRGIGAGGGTCGCPSAELTSTGWRGGRRVNAGWRAVVPDGVTLLVCWQRQAPPGLTGGCWPWGGAWSSGPSSGCSGDRG